MEQSRHLGTLLYSTGWNDLVREREALISLSNKQETLVQTILGYITLIHIPCTFNTAELVARMNGGNNYTEPDEQ